MKSAVIVFPASNCDRDAAVALRDATGNQPVMAWHGDRDLPDVDLIVLPGGFSYGDYLRSGAMAARSPMMETVADRAAKGVRVIGICNGFQILTERGLLPGALLRNAGLEFVCGPVAMRVEAAAARFAPSLTAGEYVTFPIAHHDGNYTAEKDVLDRLEAEGRVAFRYVANPNGSANDIAGVVNEAGNVLGLMPHPERAISQVLGGVDGRRFFEGLVGAMAAA
ncbi:MAG: phosphoribosylformylglycinamidine synthase subunit PurQ [Alphaproteobacteria bacterium]|nr:phosphoribosylformylglycinamidine synthase subunit PurQ [Alphaproteobacteria bacterium]